MTSTLAHLGQWMSNDEADPALIRLYGRAALSFQKNRYLGLLREAEKRLSGSDCLLASAPGRTELGGNHTDHNNGRVLASAVDLDCIAAVTPTRDNRVTLYSTDYPEPISVDLGSLNPEPGERNAPEALVRGIGAARNRRERPNHGFAAMVDSNCKPGSGLSSSAAFSVLIGGVFAALDDAPLDPVQLARDGQYAENNFFDKPCGLMDQLSSAAGYTLGIDFKDPANPAITRIETNFEDWDYRLLIIDTGGSHSDLTAEYAAVTEEIGQATRILNKDKARGLSVGSVLEQVGALRSGPGDRALLRLLHFITEDQRAADQTEALLRQDYDRFLELVKQSGDSSCKLLQNCSSAQNSREQGILLAISLTDQLFPEAICRVHGGGFAGTVQAYVPNERFDDYQLLMERVFGERAVIPVVTGRPGFCFCGEDGWVFPGAGEVA